MSEHDIPDEADSLEPNSAAGSDNEYDLGDGFLAGDDEDEESNNEPSDDEEYDSLEDSAEEDDSDDPDYEDLDLEQLQADNEKKTAEIIALKALVRSYEHTIKELEKDLRALQKK